MKPGLKMLAATTARRGGETRESRGNDYGRSDGRENRMDYGAQNRYDGAEGNYRDSGGRANYDSPQNAYRGAGGRDARNEYNGAGMSYYGAENRFRDRRGREHYDNGRFAPMRNEIEEMDEPEDAYEVENRRRYRRRSDGRFAPRGEYGGMEMYYPVEPDVPPVWREEPPPAWPGMNLIGFGARGENNRRGNVIAMRGRNSGGEIRFDRDAAEEWMHGLHNADGTKGPYWSFESAKQLMAQKGLKYDPVRFWAALNAVYSNLCAVAKKHGQNNVDYYIDAAVANWLEDEDAVDDKLAAYYAHVVKH